MVAVWPGRLYGVDFFEIEIDGHWSECELRQGEWGSDIAKLIGEGLGRSWDGYRPLTPRKKNLKKIY